MSAEPFSTPPGPVMEVSVPVGRPAELLLAGEIGAEALRELEERLSAPPLREAQEWLVDMSRVTRIDLACAYALLRAATLRPVPATLTIRGARRAVQRTLHHAGLDTVAVTEER
ncbi:STAS domain-containing protein [Streptomyces spirodelae]|uniref:STAS domain-containing protein n=1 Tax=Streptomyces spirodelae TaxID=2812904 RepID=A0ABS3WQ52_9ACTN|nr:STAS domain-containing protein [Streptomyces spirodelae]MBO8185247.1 STAS domain-containing protein [Streptomyces spirodelae]